MSIKNGKQHTMHKQRKRRLNARIRSRGYDLAKLKDKVLDKVKENNNGRNSICIVDEYR